MMKKLGQELEIDQIKVQKECLKKNLYKKRDSENVNKDMISLFRK